MSSPSLEKPAASTTTTTTTNEDLAVYLLSVAERLQTKTDEVTENMSKKVAEITKRIDALERSLKQPATAAATTTAATQEDELK